MTLQAPFPWFGGKSRCASIVWERFGDVPSYVEPFFGSGAMLLGRPSEHGTGGWPTETVNDKDGLLANFWRATRAAPQEVAGWCDWPVNEVDLTARHLWLVGQIEGLTGRLMGDPDYYDAKVAGWWCWGLCAWIGAGWCSGRGPWAAENGVLVKSEGGVVRKRPALGNAGRGVVRQLPHLGNAGLGIGRTGVDLLSWFVSLSDRLRRVRVCCGDWRRVTGESVLFPNTAVCGVFLDPPYGSGVGCDPDLYREESGSVAADVRDWCAEHGADKRLRIALCGYAGEHELPGWDVVPWKARGGYGAQGEGAGRENAGRERIWFSPGCLKAKQGSLF